jgi:hypothetical protein
MKMLILLLLILNACVAQTGEDAVIIPSVRSVSYKIGNRNIEVIISKYGQKDDPVYVNMHDDEKTSILATRRLLEKTGGLFIKIENAGLRNISFKQNGLNYTFDPNRMFSRTGIHQTLMNHGRSGENIISAVEKFGKWFLKLIPANPSCIIALHNNTDGKFSVESYLSGNDRARDAKAVHINPQDDPDDFFLTTDSNLFASLAKENFNTVLQNNKTAKKDGSLSIWCGENGMNYLNCETQHGRLTQYSAMIEAASRNISPAKPAGAVMAFKSDNRDQRVSLANETPIWFGEKKVGLVVNTDAATNGNVSGRIAFEKSFPLYSNMDFFILANSNGQPRLEVRIDPTRKKEPISATTLNFKFRKNLSN